MERIIDLTRTLIDNTSMYPGDDSMKLYQRRFIEKDGYNDHQLETGMHVGTHIDAPMHMTDKNIYVSDITLDKLIGKGYLIDTEGMNTIDYKEEYEGQMDEESIVIIYTGYSEWFGTDKYFKQHPVVSEEFARMLVRKKIKAVCIDTPSPDRYPFVVHKLLLDNDIVIVENLMNVAELKDKDEFEMFIIPLNIRADGSMARVFARVN